MMAWQLYRDSLLHIEDKGKCRSRMAFIAERYSSAVHGAFAASIALRHGIKSNSLFPFDRHVVTP